MRRSTVLVSVAAGFLAMLLVARPVAAQTQEVLPQLMPCGCLQVTPEGLAAARERDAVIIVSVVAGAQIPSTPASLVPDALAPLVSVSLDRVLGEGRFIRIRGLDPRWSSVQVNGDRLPSVDGQSRATPLDILPADFFTEIEVSRTLAADMDGDAIGGIVNLIPRRPTEETRGSMALSGGYRGLRGDADNVGVNGMIGRRVDHGRIGIAVGGSFLRDTLAGNGFNTLYLGENYNPLNLAVQREIVDRTRGGGQGDVDVKLSDRTQLVVSGFFSQLRDRDQVRGIGFSQYVYDFQRDIGDRPSSATLWNTGTTVLHQLSDHTTLDARVGIAQGRLRQDNGLYAAYFLPSPQFQSNPQGQVVDPATLQLTVLNDNPALYIPQSESLIDNTARDTTVTAAANITTRVLKFGVKARSLSLSHDWNVGQGLPTASFASVLDRSFDTGPILDGRYTLGPTLDLASVRDAGATALQYPADMNAISDYGGRETTLAGYVMGDLSIGSRIKVRPGVRYEYDRRSYHAFRIICDYEPIYTITPSESAENRGEWLPMISMSAALTANTTLRVSGTRSLARPDFDQLAPLSVYYLNTLSITGNPALRSTTSWNGDLMLDQQLAHGSGRVSVGLFGKRISDPIYVMNVNNVGEPENGDRATLAGLEIDYSQQLHFLPGRWSGLGVSASYTLSHSTAIVPNRIGDGTSAVYPDRPGHDVTLPGPPRHLGPVAANYNYARLSVFVDLFNLTNASTRMYQNDATHPLREESYGRWAVFGARFTF
jgi:TonB-dependent receptor